MIIQNIIFSELDKKINNNKRVLGYSRYVDDILILIRKEDFNDSLENTFTFLGKEDKMCFFDFSDSEVLINKKIEINMSKKTIRKADCVVSKVLMNSNLLFSSFSENIIYSLNLSNYSNDTETIMTKNLIDSAIIAIDENKDDSLVSLLDKIPSVVFLNSYTMWNTMIQALSVNNSGKFKSKLEDIIKNEIIECGDSFFFGISSKELKKLMIETLKNEIDTALILKKDRRYFLNKVSQSVILDYIKDPELLIHEFFPYNPTYEDIAFYLMMNKESISFVKLKDMHFDLTKFHYNVDQTYKQEKIKTEKSILQSGSEDLLEFEIIDLSKLYSCHRKNVKVAVTSINMKEDHFKEIYDYYPPEYSFHTIKKLIDEAAKNEVENILFPEFCVLFSDAINLIRYCRKKGISVIAGLSHYVSSDEAINYTLIYDINYGLPLLKRKNYYPIDELICLGKKGYFVKKVSTPYYYVLKIGDVCYSTMTCYEATNIIDRASFSGLINILYVPVYNKDTNYFSHIISSTSRDLSCFVVQSNNSNYGDSRVTAPKKTILSDVVQLKGGDNNYLVVCSLPIIELNRSIIDDIKLIEDIYSKYGRLKDLTGYFLRLEKDRDENKERSFKPVSARKIK